MTRAEAIRRVEYAEGKSSFHVSQNVMQRLHKRCARCSGDGWVSVSRKGNVVRCRMCGGRKN